jgi:putative ABC transport system permease protein
MVLLQLGFLEAVKITAANNFEQVDFDIVLLSPRYEQFYAAGCFPLDRLKLAQSLETVISAAPMQATFNLWRCPGYPVDQPDAESTAQASPGPLERWLKGANLPRPLLRRELFVMGIDLEKPISRAPPRPDRDIRANAMLKHGSC